MDVLKPRMPSSPGWALPESACDTHTHVFGPFDRYPLPSSAPLTPPSVHRAAMKIVGAQRSVVLQPSSYGLDNSALLAATEEGAGSVRGVAAATSAASDSELEKLHAGGIRALRFVETPAAGGGRRPGSVAFSEIEALAPRMRDLGWHASIWATPEQLLQHLPLIKRATVPVVVEHLGMANSAAGTESPEFQHLRDWAKDGLIWLKMTICRLGRSPAHETGLRSMHESLIKHALPNLIWGSDWPFVNMTDPPDTGHLLDQLRSWVTDEHVLTAILADNPSRLYFADMQTE